MGDEFEQIKKALEKQNKGAFKNMQSLLKKLFTTIDEKDTMSTQLASLTEVDAELRARYLEQYDAKIEQIKKALKEVAFAPDIG